ncbi:YcaO-like family protein [Poriferisphaera corsica]|uniref:YcaO-like family protein n=1 Tax=Poriferisphaera corsica TaxID=2528020 RepID=A0A517YQN7_9BACT|nr:YcaO-like family protein [Poriferisphaera corsica]QDU32521.1 YcaO-like family protein [Poriferisphaera corsica]
MVAGTGKGGDPFCEAGAFFEAIEHLYSEQNLPGPEEMVVMGTHALADQAECGGVGEGHLGLEMLREFPDQRVYCTAIKEWGGERELVLPVFFWSPNLLLDERYVCEDANIELYAYMMKYCSNSGVASGMRREDAVLHGINEGIERDGYGALLYRYFYCDEGEDGGLPVIDMASLPPNLQGELGRVERHVGGECVLIDATTDIGVPVVGAVFKGKGVYGGSEVGTPGFGCSL